MVCLLSVKGAGPPTRSLDLSALAARGWGRLHPETGVKLSGTGAKPVNNTRVWPADSLIILGHIPRCGCRSRAEEVPQANTTRQTGRRVAPSMRHNSSPGSCMRRGRLQISERVVSMARPLKYKTVEALQAAIDAYFESCEGYLLHDTYGNPVFDKQGQPVIVGVKPPTVTGLALALGFTSRRQLLDYQGRAAFSHTVTRAKARCEEYAERRLYDRDGARGAQFSLEHNFRWGRDGVSGGRDQMEDDPLTKALKEEAGKRGPV